MTDNACIHKIKVIRSIGEISCFYFERLQIHFQFRKCRPWSLASCFRLQLKLEAREPFDRTLVWTNTFMAPSQIIIGECLKQPKVVVLIRKIKIQSSTFLMRSFLCGKSVKGILRHRNGWEKRTLVTSAWAKRGTHDGEKRFKLPNGGSLAQTES